MPFAHSLSVAAVSHSPEYQHLFRDSCNFLYRGLKGWQMPSHDFGLNFKEIQHISLKRPINASYFEFIATPLGGHRKECRKEEMEAGEEGERYKLTETHVCI